MTPTTIIQEAAADGVKLLLSPTETIKATGDSQAVNRWLALIREHKAAIIDALKKSIGCANHPDESRLHGFTLAQLQAVVGNDWGAISGDSRALETLSLALQTRAMREHGQCPPHYTKAALCRFCGPVALWPSAPTFVNGCPWCMNRAQLRPIPLPMVTCAKCQRFLPGDTSSAGTGTCRIPSPKPRCPALWPQVERLCKDWRPRDTNKGTGEAPYSDGSHSKPG